MALPPLPPGVIAAPAKLTRSLRITGVRADGMHLIDAEMVTIDLIDEIVITRHVGRQRTDPPPPRTPAGIAAGVVARAANSGAVLDIGPPERNLVVRALDLLAEVDPRHRGRFDIELTKRIPPGAGLGGGSADAAAVLRAAGWTGSRDELDRAGELGADVPFCLVGGRARVTGIGEVVEPRPFVPLELTLALPPFGCSTPAVYQAWDALGGLTADGANDLEAAALAVEPRLAEWRDRLGEATGQVPCLAGSGSAWFVEGAFPGDGRVVVATIPALS
jgi:4-diphosphocytidyl-2-C-methyl-D-erythritol kinase